MLRLNRSFNTNLRLFNCRHSLLSNFSRSLSSIAFKDGIILSVDDESMNVKWTNQTDISRYSHLWLRDNCHCSACLHPTSRQKLHSSADIPLDIKPTKVEILNDNAVFTWNKPLRHGSDNNGSHVSLYPLAFLKQYQSKSAANEFRYNDLQPQTWNANEYSLQWVSYDKYMNTEVGLRAVIDQLFYKGLVFLKDVPLEDASCTKVAERIGPIQETFYGRDFDVKNVAKSTNIAYTSLYLGFHMDLMYMECPPGIQLLHSLKNTVTGGASIFVDSFRAVQLLKDQHPEEYQILKQTPVTFHYLNNGHHMYFRRPTIVTDESQGGPAWGSHINYAPQFQGPLDGLSPQQTRAFYGAFQKLAEFIENPSLRFEITLQPGQLVMFVNRRVLHGRTSFDPQSGDRHLKGTYLSLDSLKDKFRVFNAKSVRSNK